MRVRKLGISNLNLSIIGMGCWQYGGGHYWGNQSQNDVNLVVKAAIDAGINYFDTAEVYNNGASEISLGIAIKEYRDKVIIGSKVSPQNCEPESLRNHLEASLKRLQTDYLDLYMLHWPIEPHSLEHFTSEQELIQKPPSLESAFKTLRLLQDEGKIRYIGISNHGIKQMTEILDTKSIIIANELPYNLFCRAIETSIIPFCKTHSIGIIGYMALLQGILSGKYHSANEVPPPQAHSRHFKQIRGGQYSRHNEEGTEEEMFSILAQMREIAKDEQITISELAISWVIANCDIACNLIGSRNITQFQENIRCLDYHLPTHLKFKLDNISLPILEKLGLENPDYYEPRDLSRIR